MIGLLRSFSFSVAATEVFFYVVTPMLFLALRPQVGLILSLIIGVSAAFDILKEAPVGKYLDRSNLPVKSVLRSSLVIAVLGFMSMAASLAAEEVMFILFVLLGYIAFSLASGMINISLKGLIVRSQASDSERQIFVQEREKFRMLGFCGIIIFYIILSSFASFREKPHLLYVTLIAGLILLYGLLNFIKAPNLLENSSNREEVKNFSTTKLRSDVTLRILFIIQGIILTALGFTSILYVKFVTDYLALPHFVGVFILLYFVIAVMAMRCITKLKDNIYTWWKFSSLIAGLFFLSSLLLAGQNEFVRIFGFSIICIITGVSLAFDLSLPGFYFAKHVQQKSYPINYLSSLWSIVLKLGLALSSITVLVSSSVLEQEVSKTILTPVFYIVVPSFLKIISVIFINQLQRKPL